jgi:hypothetical protein
VNIEYVPSGLDFVLPVQQVAGKRRNIRRNSQICFAFQTSFVQSDIAAEERIPKITPSGSPGKS